MRGSGRASATRFGSVPACATSAATRCPARRSSGPSRPSDRQRLSPASATRGWCSRRYPGYDGRTPHVLYSRPSTMTTYISDQQAQRLAEIDLRKREAWAEYTEELRELRGRDYEEAEDQSWDRLQKTLKQLDGERQLVEGV